jgi:uncharacterized phiE125 gp8 family phage protein
MSIVLTTPPAIEPVTLDEAKAHLKVDTTDDDALIGTLICAARSKAEWNTGRAFITQGWTLAADCWPQDNVFELPFPPLQSVGSVTAYALDDTATVLDPSTWQADTVSAPARLALKTNASPPVNLRALNAIEIVFTAGYGDSESDVPALIREAILEIVADMYVNRGDTDEIPLAAMALLAPYRILNI